MGSKLNKKVPNDTIQMTFYLKKFSTHNSLLLNTSVTFFPPQMYSQKNDNYMLFSAINYIIV